MGREYQRRVDRNEGGFIRTYQDAILNSGFGLSNKTVLSMYEDENSMIWLGTDGGE